LKRFIDFDLSPKELAAVLTSVGLECDTVEEVESIRGGLKGVVIGKVLTCEIHPNSDHLHITTCDLGTGEPTQIVCGAPNVAAGQTVVVATVGTTLYSGDDEFKIKKSKIRGVESFGMICAEDEIGVGTSHDGIIVLNEEITPGTPAAEYYKLESDFCLEVELTPNRVDAASHLGVARDLKAYLECRAALGEEVKGTPAINIPSIENFKPQRLDGAAAIEVIDQQGCHRYSGITIRGVKVQESPEWLKQILIAAGQRPINNIVDITNYILLGFGQPLHCFDLAHVKGEKIVVRTCEEGTPFVTLDGVEHKLSSADLMICDTEKPLCIAGVFGGLNSGVTESTTDVFIESAYFNPTRVRRTARRQGLSTDASFRYERGTDPNILPYAAKLAALLIQELAGGEICGDLADTKPEGMPAFPVELNLDYCSSLIGKNIDKEVIVRILKALEIEVSDKDEKTLALQVPQYRVDVTRPCDVVEDILRIYGYNNVEFGMEMHATLSHKQPTDFSYQMQEIAANYLSAAGFREIMNNSLSAVDYYADNNIYPLERAISLLNPLSRDLGILRQTLLYGGLESIAHNVNRKATDLQFFEFGKIYSRGEGEITNEAPLKPFHESLNLGIWITGNAVRQSWNKKEEATSIFDLKAVVENIFVKLGIPAAALQYAQSSDDIYAAKLDITNRGGKHVGTLGIIRHTVTKKFDIEQEVCFASLEWDAIYKLAASNKVEFTPLPKTQPVRRDLALLLDTATTFAQVEEAIKKAERRLLQSITLFDVYEGKNIPAGKKSYAVAITLQDMEKTLNDKQIDAVMHKIMQSLEKNLGAQLR
jgi:phenylalanyl-tRNA synthetase beta chain